MKKNYRFAGLFWLSVIGITTLRAQEEPTKLSSITLHVAQPTVNESVTDVQKVTLVTKIEGLITESGVASSDFNNAFLIEPKFLVTNLQKTAGGMRNMVVADCSFSLTVKQNAGAVFSQYAKTIKGTGFTDAEAVSNAISQIDPADEKAVAFIAKAKDKIVAYYNQNCEMIIQKAERSRQVKEFGQALSILLTVPEEANSCYAKAQAKAGVAFRELQNLKCKKYLLEAQTYAANKHFDNALETLSWIDPTGVCSSEAKALVKKIEGETTDDKKKRWQYVFRALDGTIEVGKARAAAMTNLTLYLMRQPGRTILIN